jgi:hypothetical protein
MTAVTTSKPAMQSPPLLDAFIERADARALLWSIGEIELQEAVDKLQHDAERCGLVDMIGQDRVQQIISDAFRPYREGASFNDVVDDVGNDRLPANWHKLSLSTLWNRLNDPRQYRTPQVTIEAVLYCVRERGLAALREPANIERLSRCDRAARNKINRRIVVMLGKCKGIIHESAA